MTKITLTEDSTTSLEEVGRSGRSVKQDQLRIIVHVPGEPQQVIVIPLNLLPIGILNDTTIDRLLAQRKRQQKEA
jgi:hypothetical protein